MVVKVFEEVYIERRKRIKERKRKRKKMCTRGSHQRDCIGSPKTSSQMIRVKYMDREFVSLCSALVISSTSFALLSVRCM